MREVQVVAVGVLIPFAAFDNWLDGVLREAFGISTGLLLTGSMAALVFAYLVRFFALALNSVEAGLSKINRNLDDAARVLGRSSLIHLSLPGHSGADLHLHARVPGRFLPAEDQAMGIHLDPSQTFVFLKPG